MIKENFDHRKRILKTITITSDLVIVGGGMSGVCAALTAAREGIKVVLVQDRPMLGGNASSEVRLWILGATSHMGNNNRWAREGGVIDEILVENTFRNKEGNPVILDTIILEKVKNEPNITLLLNTVAFDIEKDAVATISKVMAFCSQNQTFYDISAPLFCDASGDGIIAYRAGAGYRMGAEERFEMYEDFAPDNEYGELLGHTIYFYSKDTGKPVKFIPPDYALKDITKIPRFVNINAKEHGCKYWWLEYGGRLDTIHDTEEIKWELWSVVYGVWDYIKNSGKFVGVENLTLEWVGMITGRRESRRFEGYYRLNQQDIVLQKHFGDAVAFGGWAIDLHPADGVYSEKSGCNQYHTKGIYQIPLGCYISKDIINLFYAGRIISTSHIAHGSSRVMATSAHGAQVVGMAAAYCMHNGLNPVDIFTKIHIKTLQDKLNIAGQSIPLLPIAPMRNLAVQAKYETSCELQLDEIPFNDDWLLLNFSVAQMLPMAKNTSYTFEVEADVSQATILIIELRHSVKPENHTPEVIVEQLEIALLKGIQSVKFAFSKILLEEQYGFVTFHKNDDVRLRISNERYTGVLTVFNKFNAAVNNHGKQIPPANSGFESFEFWCPERRPSGKNIAMTIKPAIKAFGTHNLAVGYTRPTSFPNAWVASLTDKQPKLKLKWNKIIEIKIITLYFDTDFDHPMESVQMGHPENVMPFCVRNYCIWGDDGKLLFDVKNNHQSINRLVLKKPESVSEICIELEHPLSNVPAGLFYIYIK